MISLFPKSEVVQYHDVLTEKVMANLRRIPAEAFMKATTSSLPENERLADSKTRLTSIAWISGKQFRISMNISKLTERITGLKVVDASSEDLQVAGYTPGGHYAEHRDTVAVIMVYWL